jgi:uncharacterized protein involved in exopolysaccharide biosynthesis
MDNNNEVELRDYIEALLRRKWIIILVFFVTTISAGVGALYLVKPVYQATALLMISKPRYQVELEPKIKTPIPLEISLETYKNLIKSADLEGKVIKKLGLDQPPDELTIEALDKMVSVEAVPKTDLIKISVESGVPGEAKEIVNTWVALFIEENKDLNLRETKEAQSFIENQLKISEENLFLSEEELREFNEKSRIDSLKKEIEEKLTKMMSYELELADVRTSLEKGEAKAKEIFRQILQVKIRDYQSKLADLRLSILREESNFKQLENELKDQHRIVSLSKSVTEDQFFNQLLQEITGQRSLALSKLQLQSEQLNPLFISWRGKLTNSTLSIENMTTECKKLTEIDANLQSKIKEVSSVLDTQDMETGNLIKTIGATLFEISKIDASSLESSICRDLKRRLTDEIISIQSLNAKEHQLTKNINSYRARIELLRKELAAEELTKSRLERIRNTANSVYEVVSQKAAETKIAVATETGVVKIVSLAHEPENPVGPGKRRIVLIGGVLGLFMGIFIAFFVDYWKRTEKSQRRR